MSQAGSPFSFRTLQYGPAPSQQGDLYLPVGPRPPVVCMFHGGFWRKPFGRDQLIALAEDLTARGFAVWNCGYRRVGEPGGGWPGTLQDAESAIEHLAIIAAGGLDLDLHRVALVGHSAGGQLALCAAARDQRKEGRRVRPVAVAGLAAVTDLARAWELHSGNGAVSEFLGGAPARFPGRYAMTSPIERLPLGVRQLILHGSKDEALPIELARDYASAVKASGDQVEFIELPEAGHMDFLLARGEGHAALCRWLEQVKTG